MPLEAVPAGVRVFIRSSPASTIDIGDFHITPIALNHPVRRGRLPDRRATARRGPTSPTPRRSTRCSTSSTSCRAPEPLSDDDKLATVRDARGAGPPDHRRRHRGVRTPTSWPDEYAKFPPLRATRPPDQALEICAEAQVPPDGALPPRRRPTVTTRWIASPPNTSRGVRSRTSRS